MYWQVAPRFVFRLPGCPNWIATHGMEDLFYELLTPFQRGYRQHITVLCVSPYGIFNTKCVNSISALSWKLLPCFHALILHMCVFYPCSFTIVYAVRNDQTNKFIYVFSIIVIHVMYADDSEWSWNNMGKLRLKIENRYPKHKCHNS